MPYRKMNECGQRALQRESFLFIRQHYYCAGAQEEGGRDRLGKAPPPAELGSRNLSPSHQSG